MRMYLLGLATIPVIWLVSIVVAGVIQIVRCAVRDMIAVVRHGLKPGWNRWHWAWVGPWLFADLLWTQARAWWKGYEVRVVPR